MRMERSDSFDCQHPVEKILGLNKVCDLDHRIQQGLGGSGAAGLGRSRRTEVGDSSPQLRTGYAAVPLTPARLSQDTRRSSRHRFRRSHGTAGVISTAARSGGLPGHVSHLDRHIVLLSGHCWPLSMRPRHYDRFVLIGLCWLYGRSEFPPPPPLMTNLEECSSDNVVAPQRSLL